MAWEPKRIVAAVDGSPQSVAAAQKAVDIATLAGGSVTLVTVVRPPEGWWGLEGAPPSPQALAAAVAAGQRQVLDQVVDSIQVGSVEITTLEEIGDPVSSVISICVREEADLLVIGRRGAGLVERMMIGSVADRLAHHSPCPLLIVP